MSTVDDLQTVSNLVTLLRQAPAPTASPAGDIWSDLVTTIKNALKPLFDGVVNSVSSVVNDIKTAVTNAVTPIVNGVTTAVSNVINGVTGGIAGALNDLSSWIKGVINSITSWVETAISNIRGAIDSIGSWIEQAISGLSNWVATGLHTVITSVAGWIAGAIDDIGAWIRQAYQDVKDWLATAINNVRDWIGRVQDEIARLIREFGETISNLVQKAKETIITTLGDVLAWFNKLTEGFREWFWRTLGNIAGWINEKVLPYFANAVEGAQTLVKLGETIWGFVSKGDYTGAFNLLDSFAKEAGIPAPISTLRSIVSAIGYFWETVRLQFIPMEVAAQKRAIIGLAMEPADMGSMAHGVFKGVASLEDFYNNAALAGITKERAKVVFEATKGLPSPGQVQQAFLRGEINVTEHDKMLRAFGLDDNYIELIKSLYMIIPGPSDLIRMAVKEAFTPEIANKFGQYQDYPEAFTAWAAKIGLSKDWAERYWAAHWELPSVTMGFEMLHRDIISNEELTVLLRALDIMPYWRERLIQMSYNPLTRVDVRRMYQLGVIDESQVKRSYLDLGYDEQKADWLTEFTVRYYTPEDQTQQDEYKSIARSTYSTAFKRHIISEDEYRQFLSNLKIYPDDIELLVRIDEFSMQQQDKLFDLSSYRKDYQKLVLNAYDRGLLHVNEIKPMLLDMGYSEQEADLEISLSDYNRALAIRNMIVRQVHEQYIGYMLSVPDLYSLLDQFNFSPEEVGKLQEEWDIERSLRTRRPTMADLRKFLAAKLLTPDQFLDELRGMGYNERYVEMYAASL